MFTKPEDNFKVYAVTDYLTNNLLPDGHIVCASLPHGSRVFVTTRYRGHIFTVDNKVTNLDFYKDKTDIIGMRTNEKYDLLDLFHPLDLVYVIPIGDEFELDRLENLKTGNAKK